MDRAMLNFDFKFIACIILSSFVLVTIAAGTNNISVSGSVNNTSSTGMNYKILGHNQKLTNIHW